MKKKGIVLGVIVVMFGLCSVYGFTPLINKYAFYPERDYGQYAEQLNDEEEEVFFPADDGVVLQSYFLSSQSSEKLLIYFHGNAGNVSDRLPDLRHLRQLGINVLGVSYRGYGKSEGKPSERGIYRDGTAALDYAIESRGFREENIVLFGRSIGASVVIEMAQQRSVAGIVLVTPLTRGKECAKMLGFGLFSFLAGDSFDNLSKAPHLIAPVLVVHGTADTIIPWAMGKKVFDEIKAEKKFVSIESAGHNDLSTQYSNEYWTAIDTCIRNICMK